MSPWFYRKFKNMLVKNQSGYVTLLSVLVVGAVGVAVSTSLLLLGLGISRTGFSFQQLYQAKALSSACTEEALQKVRNDTLFFGSGSLSLGQGNCDYTVTNQGGQNRLVTVTGTVGTIVRRTKVILSTINPKITITSWQEISSF
ncbi:MAG: hypothetical protein IPJ67_00675 [Candidatus Moraniibacteriota bacterium]|nr:MAG: hypothetical protein IPJ67_00675 [Candidatus Moranbacteria bacterium]